MAELAAPVLTFALESATEYITYNVNLVGGVNENIHQLLTEMEKMKAFVKKCTEKNNDDEYLEKLAYEVQDVVFQAEDTIEKYIVFLYQKKHKSRFGNMNPFGKLWDMRSMGKECQQVSTKMKELYQNTLPLAMTENRDGASTSVHKRRAHSPEEDNIIGFVDVAEDVKKLLTGDSLKLEVHSIVGMVGLGKTTLARKVYRDPDIEYRFFARAFVSVSEVYDKKSVLLKILHHFVRLTSDIMNMHVDSIQDMIKEELKGKQYFIVMDDVWDENAWNDLVDVFPRNEKQSRVLITTRKNSVAHHANASVKPYELRNMNPSESQELLRWKVFGDTGCPSDLEMKITNIETQILEKCWGLPLAIVVVAGIILPNKYRVDSWIKVYGRVKISEHVTGEMSSNLIGLSFNNLPYYLKQCFLYLGIFPEDFDIPVWKLLRLWIAEGFIKGKGSLEDIAEIYLEELVDRNLVIVAEIKWNGQIKKCRVHDFLREFCKTEAMKRNLFQEINGSSAIDTGIFVDDYLRISINSEVLDYVLSKPSCKRLRSFLSFQEKVLMPEQHVRVIPKAFGMLRVFDAMEVKFKSFPPDIFYLILLKYVAMSCDVDIISQKLYQLSNLQTFIFKTECPILTIKADIWMMEHLRHLHINTSATLPPVTAGSINTKSKLQTLTTIAPENCTREAFEKCKAVKKMGIKGNLARCAGWLENISILESLENLKLINSDAKVPLPYLPDDKKFPCMLNKLTLYGTGVRWEHMSTLGKLENLMALKLKDNAFVGDFWKVKEAGFASLSMLHIDKTDLLVWEASSGQFPVLTTLILKNCKRLRSIPHDFGTIITLQSIYLEWTNPTVVLSAKEIEVLKLKTQTEKKSPMFKFDFYPKQS